MWLHAGLASWRAERAPTLVGQMALPWDRIDVRIGAMRGELFLDRWERRVQEP